MAKQKREQEAPAAPQVDDRTLAMPGGDVHTMRELRNEFGMDAARGTLKAGGWRSGFAQWGTTRGQTS